MKPPVGVTPMFGIPFLTGLNESSPPGNWSVPDPCEWVINVTPFRFILPSGVAGVLYVCSNVSPFLSLQR